MKLKVQLVVAAALLAAACGTDATTEDATIMAAAAITDAQSTEVPMRLELADGRPSDARQWAHEGFQCDTTPTDTTVDVCGKTYPAELHLDWSSCQLQACMRGGPGGGPPSGIGGTPPSGTVTQPSITSSGTVDVVSTTTAQGECTDSTEIQTQQQSTHNIQHTTPDGQVVTLSGTVTSTSSRAGDAGNRSQSSTYDTTRARVDASGTPIDSVHVTGTLESTFDQSGETPQHTSNGSMTVTQADGTTSSVTLTDVVRVPRETCDWPTSARSSAPSMAPPTCWSSDPTAGRRRSTGQPPPSPRIRGARGVGLAVAVPVAAPVAAQAEAGNRLNASPVGHEPGVDAAPTSGFAVLGISYGFLSEGTSPVSTQMNAIGSHFTGKMGLMPEPRSRPASKSGYGSHSVSLAFLGVPLPQATTGQMPFTLYSALQPFSL